MKVDASNNSDSVGAPDGVPDTISNQVQRVIRAIPWATGLLVLLAGVAFTVITRITASAYLPISLSLSAVQDEGTGQGAVLDRLLLQRLAALPGVDVAPEKASPEHRPLSFSGQVRPAGQHWIVDAQLTTATGDTAWAQQLQVDADEMDRVVEATVSALQNLSEISFDQLKQSRWSEFVRAQALLSAGSASDIQLALSQADRVISEAPSFAPGHASRSIACASTADLVCAGDSARQALQLDPKLAIAWAAKGRAAILESQACLNASCDSRALLRSAQGDLKRALTLRPRLRDAHEWLANAHELAGDLAAASEQTQAALRLDPMNAAIAERAAHHLVRQARYAEARALLTPMLEEPVAQPRLWVALAESAAQSGNVDEAIQWSMQSLSGAASGSKPPAVEAATVCLRFGRPTQARAILDTWPSRDSMTAEQFVAQAWNEFWLGGREGVAAYVAGSATGSDGSREGRLARAVALSLAGRDSDALGPMRGLLGTRGPLTLDAGLQDIEMEAAIWMADIERRQGANERSREIARSVLQGMARVESQGFGSSSSFQARKALVLALAGQIDEAGVQLNRALRAGWSSPLDLHGDPRWQQFVGQPGLEQAVASIDETAERNGVRLAGIAGLQLAQRPPERQ